MVGYKNMSRSSSRKKTVEKNMQFCTSLVKNHGLHSGAGGIDTSLYTFLDMLWRSNHANKICLWPEVVGHIYQGCLECCDLSFVVISDLVFSQDVCCLHPRGNREECG